MNNEDMSEMIQKLSSMINNSKNAIGGEAFHYKVSPLHIEIQKGKSL